MRLIDSPSPNHGPRAAEAPVDMLILHYTGMATAAAALTRLRDPEAQVSAHYLIEEDGAVHALVPEDRRAWHAGVAEWAGETDINSRSIGIELVNPGHEFGYRAFPEAQMAALEGLAQDILARRRIPKHRILGHSDVAPRRKADPGELFDWPRLARAGIGLWPDTSDMLPLQGDLPALQRLLAAYGYACPQSRELDSETRAVITAFHRHFRPDYVSDAPDAETLKRITRLCAMAGLMPKA